MNSKKKKFMKKTMLMLAVFMAATFVSHAQVRIGMDVILGRHAPNSREAQLMHQEEMGHPNITTAMHHIQAAMTNLQNAPATFGGHKGQAQTDLLHAYESLRKALYYRLYDDRQ
jgi:hypothetical protein